MCGIRPVGGCITSTSRKLTPSTRIEVAEVQDGVAGLRVARVAVAGVNTGNLKDLAIAADRHRLLAVNTGESMNLTRVPLAVDGDRVAGSEEQLSDGYMRDGNPVVSPDGLKSPWAAIEQVPRKYGFWTSHHVAGNASTCRRRLEASSPGLLDARQSAPGRDAVPQNGTSAFWYIALDGGSTEQILPPTRAPHHQWVCGAPDNGRII